MINLLPDNTKRQIKAARTNVLLTRYIIIIGFAALFLAGVSITGYIILSGIKSNAQLIIDANANKASEYGSVEADAASLQSSLASAKSLFDSEINYPLILTTIGSLTPQGVIVESLDLNATTLAAPIDIQVYAKTTDQATALQTALTGSPMFSGVTTKSLSSSNGLDDYPVNAVITVTINKDAAL